MIESWHTCIESRHTYEWVTSHMSHAKHEWVMVHLWMSLVTLEWVMAHLWMRHVTHEWVMSRICMSHVTHMYESCHTYAWVKSHIWMGHVIREVGGWGRVPFSRNLMSPTPRRKWYLTTGRRAHKWYSTPSPNLSPYIFLGLDPSPPPLRHTCASSMRSQRATASKNMRALFAK